MSDDQDEVVLLRKRDVNLFIGLLVAGFALLALTLILLVVSLVALRGQAQDAAETHAAACSYRENLKQQRDASEKYLRENPNGAPALHISAASIQQTIDRQQAAVISLSGLHCN
jgi:hypothetical protein